ncbi:MAG TPA: hypothetical protein VJC10_03415, partial [Patescibacteria group bacterium]|nr:hypothetical protein [Patescibacteria group bacterium]
NIAGLLNIPITTKLSSLIIGSVSSTSPVDLPVTNVSTGAGANGKARPNDFNTATVGVLADGSIASIVSNIRVIDKTDPLIQADFISPTEAFEKIKTNSSDVFLTLPQGSGVVDWATIYKDNKAIADTATVTEYVLSYLEKPAADQQTYLTPMYTVRGEAKLTTGYTVSFVATVPALKDNTSFIATQTKTDLLNLFSAVPKAYAQTPKKNLQLETLTPPISQTTPVVPTSEPEVPVATPTSAPAPTGAPPGGGTECPNPAHGQNVILDIAGLGKMTVVLGAPNTYYFKSSTFPLADMNQVRDAFFLAVAEEYTVNVAQYMQQNNIKTVSDPKALFKQINGKECDDPTKGVAKAPLFNCPETRGTQFRGEFANRVADDVAAKITSIAGGDQIAEYAQKPSIFPSASLQVLFVFPAAEETGFGFGCQISGVSPALFLYPKTQTNVRVSLPSFTTYTNPSATNNIWNVTASPSGSITSSQSASILTHLYYEYNPANVSLQHPQNGYVVKYDNWTKVVSEVALTAKLNTNETQRLRLDVQNELSKHPKSNYIRLSVLTQSTLNTHLPITISPQPNLFYRLHILISPLSKQTAVKKPMIVSLFRTGFTAVEVGAHYK